MGKEFAWSFSKLKNYETCPKRYYEIDVAKNVKEAPSDALTYGDLVHKSFAAALKDSTPLPDGPDPDQDLTGFQKWIDLVRAGPGRLLVEQKYAIKKDFTKTQWFSNDVWYRGIGDVVRIDGPVALVLDWKTGKIKVDSVQLMLMAQCIFSHYPEVQRVRSEFVWLQDDCTTPEVFTRQDVADAWVGLLDRVASLAKAHTSLSFPPKPSYLCARWCPVVSCPHHGKKP